MAVEIVVPILGESVMEAVVGKWLKSVGDTIAPGDAIVELETEKVNLEVPAEHGGVLEQILKNPGETVGIGMVLGTIAESAASQHTAPAVSQPVESGAKVPGNASREASASVVTGTALPDAGGSHVPATPVARRIAQEGNIDLAAVHGTGIAGRVTKSDVAAALNGGQSTAIVAPQTSRSAQPAPASPPQMPEAASVTTSPAAPPVAPAASTQSPLAAPSSGDRSVREKRVRMSRRRQTIARRLLEAQHSAAMLTTFNEIDMTAIMEARAKRKDTFKTLHGVNLGFMSFFTKAVVAALKAFPNLNAEIQGDDIVLKSYYDIGIAVGVAEGLVVPVLRDADLKSFAQIESDVVDLATRARNNALSLSDLIGGTFTITNGGVFGSLLSTPILNTPQVGILGMHKIEERPIALNGQVVIRPMMYVALSYDHRIVDGNEAVRFLVRVKGLLEDPLAIMLEG